MAKSAADWIIANQTTDEYGAYFPADAANPKREFIADSAPDCFYSGIAGMIVTFAELAQKTGEARYRDAAVAGAERLLKRWPEIAAKPIPALDMRWAITFGIAGIGMALHQVGTMLGEPRYTAALRPIAERIVAAADHDNPKGTWTEYAGYLTDAGTVLFLVQFATLLGDRKIMNTAVKTGDRLISLATRESDGSLAWKISHNPSYPERFYPGFEYGQAGTVYTLAAIYEATREQRFLDAAKRGTQYLMGLAVGNAQAALRQRSGSAAALCPSRQSRPFLPGLLPWRGWHGTSLLQASQHHGRANLSRLDDPVGERHSRHGCAGTRKPGNVEHGHAVLRRGEPRHAVSWSLGALRQPGISGNRAPVGTHHIQPGEQPRRQG